MKQSTIIAALLMLVSAAMAGPDRLGYVQIQTQTKTAAVSPKRPHIAILGAKLFTTDRRHYGPNVGLRVSMKNIGKVPCIYANLHLRLFKGEKIIYSTTIFGISMDRPALKPGETRGPIDFYIGQSKDLLPLVSGASLEFEGYGGPYDPQCQGLYKH
ncbi:MAG: hypothetical protein WCG99_01830 [Candidatus Berkelbacteria bacterium]